MPPPLTSASRASIVDEKKRQEKVAAQKGKVLGSTVFRIDATQHNNTLQKEKGDNKKEDKDKRKSGEVGRYAVVRTGITNESTNRMVCKGNEYTPALENSNDEENVQDGNEQPCQGNVTIEELAKAEKKRLEQETDQTIERLMRKHKQEVDKIKNDLQRQHRTEIYEITYALNNKHDKEITRMQKELQDMRSKKELAEQKLEDARKCLGGLSDTEKAKVVKCFPEQQVVAKAVGNSKISASEAELCRGNWCFYQNQIYSKPFPGHKIEEMLTWTGNYGMLERNNHYIQWLFPTPKASESNVNAQQLYEHEAQAIRDDDVAHKRVLRAYKMMLDFYGMQLVSSIQGTVKRSSKGWEERYVHLNRSPHNFRRITRILKSIGELGYERFQAPWVDFLIEETVVKKELPNLNGACLMYWITAVKDGGEKELLFRKVTGLRIHKESKTYSAHLASDEYMDAN